MIAKLAHAPQWLIDFCGKPGKRTSKSDVKAAEVNMDLATTRAIDYLESAPLAIEGAGGDSVAFRVAAVCMDFGCSPDLTAELMMDHWNDRCSPPWAPDELQSKVNNAARYRQHAIGESAPETEFDDISEEVENSHPILKLNDDHAFVLAGNAHHILWETKDADGHYMLRHLAEGSFHKAHAARTMIVDKKSKRLTDLWMISKRRRSYRGLCFRPGNNAPEDWYNLWKGFSVDPAATEPTGSCKKALDAFFDHALQNVCRGDHALFTWLMGYFAHMFQLPQEKPLVSLVFRGGKGVGKNALIERVGALLGHHFMVTSNRRYLIGNFNGHMENLLMFVLDEAFWSGDKAAEGQLKDLITGKHHVIEHKGQEPYRVENLTRCAIIGNETWLVPATADERRFAVLDVGAGRKQDRNFFLNMRLGMEAGGYAHLLKYFLDFDLSMVDVNQAPATEALLDQKLASIEPIQRWWFDCLRQERIAGSDFGGQWPEEISVLDARAAFRRYCKDSNMRAWTPDERTFGLELKALSKGIITRRRQTRGGEREYYYILQPVEALRVAFAEFIGHDVDWG